MPGTQQERLVAQQREGAVLLEHVQAALRHEDELVGVEDALRVRAETRGDEEPGVERLQRVGHVEAQRHALTPRREAGRSARRGAAFTRRYPCGVMLVARLKTRRKYPGSA